MTHALQEVVKWNDIVCGGTRYGQRLKDVWGEKWGIGKHASADELRSLIGEKRWERYFTFALVRDPIERAKSMYQWTERKVESQGWRRWARFVLPRYQQDLWKWPTVKAYLDTDEFSGFIRHPCFVEAQISTPQYRYLSGNENEGLIVDRLCRLRNFEAEIEKIADIIGVDISVKEKNVSSNRNRLRVNSGDRRYLRGVYEKDYALVENAFENDEA